MNLAVVGNAPLENLRRWATLLRWRFPHLLSSAGNRINRDYHAESEVGALWPMFNVFRRDVDDIRHIWASEMLLASTEQGQEPRHADLMWPLWGVLDLTPDGRAATAFLTPHTGIAWKP